jgi:23S rRNA pseudouridine2605 synthase
MSETMRIQRALSRAGIASRRHSEELIAAGRVMVNGAVAKIGQSVDPDRDEITVDGSKLKAPKGTEWIVLNKPQGIMTTRSDPEKRRTVFDLVKNVPGLNYVGRLDYMTEGVLLLTTDGKAAHALTHPSGGVEREYLVTVRGDAPSAVRAARAGVTLPDGPVKTSEVSSRAIGGGMHELTITIAEGRKREVRRLCAALGLEVERLVRVRYGPVLLGKLQSGKSRPPTPHELRELTRLAASVTVKSKD